MGRVARLGRLKPCPAETVSFKDLEQAEMETFESDAHEDPSSSKSGIRCQILGICSLRWFPGICSRFDASISLGEETIFEPSFAEGSARIVQLLHSPIYDCP